MADNQPKKTFKTLRSLSLQDKVCVVTGAARGLGYEFCDAFLKSGCTSLAVLDLVYDEASQAAEELAQQNSTDEGEKIDAIGIACDVSSEEYPADRMRKLMDVNVHGAFFTAREAAKIMIPQGSGSIVLISSMSANIVNIPQQQAPYNFSKAAVKHMASSLAIEWAKTGVRVNALSPGYMLTKLTRTVLANQPQLKKTWENLTPFGRMGDPEDLAGAIVYLCSDASKFMTGSELRVDGGYCAI
ncbi:hypothetical protein EYR40_000855 [Pleurotus pulmonarius]|nr:hypothetical protein EYR40_000855 [Pleurotus pulmonarius]